LDGLASVGVDLGVTEEDDGEGDGRLLFRGARAWPENRVSGEAVRRGVGGFTSADRDRGLDFGSGSSLRTSFSDVIGPLLATCHGEADLSSSLLSDILGELADFCKAYCCCCFLRSF
jgi:hypothetical protein